MVSPTEARRAVRNEIADVLAAAGPVGLTKADLMAAVAGIDEYLDANAAAVNQAIPQPARGVLTTPQKAALVARVTLARFGG